MTPTDDIVQLMRQLGQAALTVSVKMEQITAKFVVEPDDELRELTDELVFAAVAFTLRLLVISKFETAETADNLKHVLIAGYREGAAPEASAEFERAVQALAASAQSYAYALAATAERIHAAGEFEGGLKEMYGLYDPTRHLANAAIALTMQLTLRHGGRWTPARWRREAYARNSHRGGKQADLQDKRCLPHSATIAEITARLRRERSYFPMTNSNASTRATASCASLTKLPGSGCAPEWGDITQSEKRAVILDRMKVARKRGIVDARGCAVWRRLPTILPTGETP